MTLCPCSLQLGRGVSGTVYLGEWENQHVAVKVITDNTMSGNDNKDEVVKEFCTEVKVLSKLRHPNVCVFLGASVSPPKCRPFTFPACLATDAFCFCLLRVLVLRR